MATPVWQPLTCTATTCALDLHLEICSDSRTIYQRLTSLLILILIITAATITSNQITTITIFQRITTATEARFVTANAHTTMTMVITTATDTNTTMSTGNTNTSVDAAMQGITKEEEEAEAEEGEEEEEKEEEEEEEEVGNTGLITTMNQRTASENQSNKRPFL